MLFATSVMQYIRYYLFVAFYKLCVDTWFLLWGNTKGKGTNYKFVNIVPLFSSFCIIIGFPLLIEAAYHLTYR